MTVPFDDAFNPAFEILYPDMIRAPVAFNSPHSGAIYPPHFLKSSCLDPLTLRRSEDAFVDELFRDAPLYGATLMRAHFPRAYIDVNREPYELDPLMFEGRLPPHANTRSMRVAGGLGTIARIVADSKNIYAQKIPVADAIKRIENLYKPYHHALGTLLNGLRAHYGMAILIDCHSMPSGNLSRSNSTKTDIILGDRYGSSCDPALTDHTENILQKRGYRVTRNRPYAGGFITEHYGKPANSIHALQIEINRALYMDEKRHELHDGFGRLQHDLSHLVQELMGYAQAEASAPPLAAE